jgi:trimethylamine--corrinoid protein Co-methyltransferase
MGHEKTLTGLIPALAGADMIYGPGMLESGITFDPAQLILDCEFVRMIKLTVNGIPVDEDMVAVDVISEIGPFGDFLGHAHTFKGMRNQSRTELIDRRMRSDWERDGSTDSYTRAVQKTRDILENHTPETLPEKVCATIRRIVEKTEMELGL